MLDGNKMNQKTAKLFRKYAKQKAPNDSKQAYKQLKREYKQYLKENRI